MTQVSYGTFTFNEEDSFVVRAEVVPLVIANDTLLLDGKVNVQTTSAAGNTITLTCWTKKFSDITTLLGLAGTKSTLTLPDGTTYTNCVISDFKHTFNSGHNNWDFTVTLKQHTA